MTSCFIISKIKKKVGKIVCQYTKINDNVFINGDIAKVIIQGVVYKTCALCHTFYKVDGNNSKYCPECRKKANCIRTSQRYKQSKDESPFDI